MPVGPTENAYLMKRPSEAISPFFQPHAPPPAIPGALDVKCQKGNAVYAEDGKASGRASEHGEGGGEEGRYYVKMGLHERGPRSFWLDVSSFSSKTHLAPEAIYFTRVIPPAVCTPNIFVISLLTTPWRSGREGGRGRTKGGGDGGLKHDRDDGIPAFMDGHTYTQHPGRRLKVVARVGEGGGGNERWKRAMGGEAEG
ncbi:hypothetical protein KM043_006892 [Ampulex compressa]|nr:hypothetical protein KM043_006892 [Ampulex compressa]